MQDVNENEMMQKYVRSPSRDEDNHRSRGANAPGFMVRDAPWSAAAPDTSSTADFPGLGGPVDPASRHAVSWGPKIKR
jgi:hypothetical protein